MRGKRNNIKANVLVHVRITICFYTVVQQYNIESPKIIGGSLSSLSQQKCSRMWESRRHSRG